MADRRRKHEEPSETGIAVRQNRGPSAAQESGNILALLVRGPDNHREGDPPGKWKKPGIKTPVYTAAGPMRQRADPAQLKAIAKKRSDELHKYHEDQVKTVRSFEKEIG